MLGLGLSLTKGVVKAITYVKDGLLTFFNFKSTGRSLHLAGSTSFDGNDSITVADSSDWDLGGAFTWSFWVKTEAELSNKAILTFDVSSYKHLIMFEANSDRIAGYFVQSSGTTSVNEGTKGDYHTKGWTHVAVTFDKTLGSARFKMFIDGVQEGTANGHAEDIVAGDQGLVFGNLSSHYLTGKLANLSLHSRALSQSEIQSIMWKNYADLTSSESTDLVSWWALQADVNDSEGSHNGTNNGATINTSPYNGNSPFVPRIVDVGEDALTSYGKVYSGRALDFDGTNDYVVLDSEITKSGVFSISCWVNIDGSSGDQYIIGRDGADSSYIRIDSGGGADVRTNGQVQIPGNQAFPSGWGHLAVTKDSSNLIRLYFNGVEKNLYGGADGSGSDYATGGSNFGSRGEGDFIFDTFMRSVSNYADGKLSNVLYFDTTLSLANIQSLYTDSNLRVPSGVSSSNLLGAWMLNEGAGSTVYDAVGTNNGTINGATSSTGINEIAQTALVRANELAVFDGSDDDVDLTSTISLGSDEISLSFWVNMDEADTSVQYMLGRSDQNNGAIGLRKSASTYIRISGNAFIYGAPSGIGSGWKHVLITRDSSDLTKMYLNGVEQTIGGSTGGASGQDGATTFNTIGSSETNFGEGIITEIAFFNADKSSSASTYYNSGTPYDMTNESGLQHYYRNEGSALWQDLKGSNHASAVNGSPSVVLFTEGVTSGKDSAGLSISDETAVANGARFYGDGYIDADSIGTMKSICFWVKPDTNGENMINTDGGSHTITASSGTISAGGFSSPTIYVNGSASTTLTANTWQFIAVTTATGFSASDFKTYTDFNGMIDEIMVYSSELSSAEVTQNYNFGKGKHS